MGDPNAPPLDSESLLGLLDRHGVAYVLVGGLAAVAHGAMRATFDIDIVPRWKPDNLDALAGALRAAGARLRVPAVAEPIETPLDGDTFGRFEVSTWRTGMRPRARDVPPWYTIRLGLGGAPGITSTTVDRASIEYRSRKSAP